MLENFRNQGRTSWDNAKFGVGLGLAGISLVSLGALASIEYEASECKPPQPALSATSACLGETAIHAAADPIVGTITLAPIWNRGGYINDGNNYAEMAFAGLLAGVGWHTARKNWPKKSTRASQPKTAHPTVTQP